MFSQERKTPEQILSDFSTSHPGAETYVNMIDSQLAYRSHYNTSFSPEVRAAQERIYFAELCLNGKTEGESVLRAAQNNGVTLPEGWESTLDTWHGDYVSALLSRFNAYLSARGNCLSSMITGPARFPVARAQKANRTMDNRHQEVTELLPKFIKSLKRQLLPHGDGTCIKSSAPDAVQQLQSKIDGLKTSQEQMKAVNKLIRTYTRKGDISIPGELRDAVIEALGKKGYSVAQAANLIKPDFCGRIGFADYQLSNNLANIKRLEQRLVDVKATQEKTVSVDETFDNGIGVYQSDDNKIVISFGFKPDEATRNTLKKCAFKWSRNRDGGTWVRMITANALFDYERTVRPLLAQLES
ncbi:hypothetical protein [Enterovibrio paralichthyis]|uniref:hypothetical protein n=1 Tax=Enterovibrio paralichthyis TaxID=2853805 RepID=UPI001C463C01|nr:hypothetical protein [Enterovibrio paralichthyis]MBV7300221.1 hypothetical protein [Enterovibrio paralichthyis]